MKKFSLILLLIMLPFTIMEASIAASSRRLHFHLQTWDKVVKSEVFIPIEAIITDNNIEIHFLQDNNEPSTLLIKDSYGNIVYQDMVVFNKKNIYNIELNQFTSGQYELILLNEQIEINGKFEIE